jgi:hypothetical protein
MTNVEFFSKISSNCRILDSNSELLIRIQGANKFQIHRQVTEELEAISISVVDPILVRNWPFCQVVFGFGKIVSDPDPASRSESTSSTSLT